MTTLAISLLALATAASPAPAHAPVGQVLPAGIGAVRELRFAKELRYAGGQRFVLKKVADAEQHFFVAAGKDNVVRRLYWIQFEKFLPGVESTYDYSADEAVTVSGVPLRRHARRWDARPEPDSDRSAMFAFLEKRGYRIPDGALRIRMVHVPENDRRQELMIVYAETPEPGKPPPVEAEVRRRVLEGLRVVARSEAGSASSDAQQLLALHEEVLRAHRENDVVLLLAAEEEDYVVANRGEVTRPERSARRERIGPYFGRTRFKMYADRTPPVVKVSSDGTLGWVIVQVEARGEQTTSTGAVEPLEFVSAWIELYEKREGRWLRVGNVSNFKPSAGDGG